MEETYGNGERKLAAYSFKDKRNSGQQKLEPNMNAIEQRSYLWRFYSRMFKLKETLVQKLKNITRIKKLLKTQNKTDLELLKEKSVAQLLQTST